MEKAKNLTIVQVPVSDLHPFEGNPRTISESGLEKIQRSIEEFGFANPVLAQKGTGMIIAGHQRIAAAKQAGLETVPVIWLDFDEATAKAYNIADNRTAQEAEWDDELLQVVVKELDAADLDILVTGLDEDEIERLLGREPEPEPEPEVDIQPRTDLPVEVITADARDITKHVKSKSIQTVITSPPYWGLRDYGIEPSVWDGDPDCDHEWGEVEDKPGNEYRNTGEVQNRSTEAIREGFKDTDGGTFCTRCGAWKGTLGLEPTPDLFVNHIVQIFEEIKKVLRDDGTIWVNMGDSYSSDSKGTGGTSELQDRNKGSKFEARHFESGLKPKDLCGIPWRVAFALQAAGWYLRSDIIWSKPNPMPESVTDRPTKAHEYVFLMAKSDRYFYDVDAVREEITDEARVEFDKAGGVRMMPPHGDHVLKEGHRKTEERRYDVIKGANRRTVWTISTKPYAGAHFATFPPDLVEVMVKAGSSPLACETCGAPWAHIVDAEGGTLGASFHDHKADLEVGQRVEDERYGDGSYHRIDRGYQPGCECAVNEGTGASVVLDPFAGSGTTLAVANTLGRAAVGLEVKEEYVQLIHRRLAEVELPEEEEGGPA